MEIKEAINKLGLTGKAANIHASHRPCGSSVGLLEAFLDAGCTVLVPSFTDMFEALPVPALMPEQNGAGGLFVFFGKAI